MYATTPSAESRATAKAGIASLTVYEDVTEGLS
jgi:hypothetical protein